MSQRHLHGFVVLVQCRGPHFDDSLARTRLRGSYLEDLAFDPKLVPWPNRSWPAEFVKPGADDAASGFDIAFHQQPHRDRGCVPAAGGETSKDRTGCGPLVEMKRLRIEFGSKTLDAIRIDADAPRAEGLSRCKIFEVALGYTGLSSGPAFTRSATQAQRCIHA